jgi:hypothetical protein
MYSRSVCKLTARQYGEPAPPQHPGRVLISRLRRDQKVVAVQTVSEPEICHGAGFKLRADARACRVIGCPYL